MTEQTPARPARPAQSSPAFRVLKWAGIVVGSLVLLFTAILLWPGTRQWAFDYGRSILTEAGVRSASITGSWSEMTLNDVALTDDDGTWATAREIVISWSPLGLLSGNVIADRIELRGGHIYRQPDYKPAPDQADEPFAWPDLPVDIDAQSLTGDLTIDAAVVGEAITATLNGKAALTSAGGNAELAIVRSDGIAGEASVTARATADLDDIEIAVNAKDSRVAARLAGDDRLRNLEVALQATRKAMSCTGQAAVSARDGALVSVGVNPDCTFAVTLADVARLLDPSAGLTGPANVSVQLREDGTDKTTNFLVAADLSRIQSTDAMLARLLPGASLHGLVTVIAGGARLNDLQGQLAGGKIAFTGNAAIGAGTHADLSLNASDLAVLRPDLKGKMQARVVYDTTAATPIEVEAKASNVVAGGYSWQAITLNGSVDPAGSGAIVLKSDGGEAPIDLTVRVADAFTALKAEAKGTVADAGIEARATQVGAAYDVAASIDAQRLDKLGALAGLDVSGALKADISGRVGVPAGSVKLKASISGGRYGGTEIGDATLDASGPLNALAVDLKGRAPLPPRTVDYALAATVQNFGSASVSSLSVKSGTEALSTTTPFTVAFTNGILVDGLDARFFHKGAEAGRVSATARQDATGVRTALRVAGVNLEAVAGLAGMAPLKGTLDAAAELDGSAGRASVKGTIAGLRATGAAGRAPPADVAFNGDWSGGRFRLSATANAQGLPGATAEIGFPLARAADGGFPSPAPNAPLSGRVSWTGRLAPLWRLADIDGQDLDGDADIQATLGGTLAKPRFTGSATLANGVYTNELSGTRLAALNLQVRANGDSISVTGSATDGGRGRMEVNLSMQGTGGLGGVSGGVALHRMQLLARDDVSGRVDGSLRLERNAAGPVLTGDLTVLDLSASIPSAGAPDLVVVDVIDPARPPQPRKAPPTAATIESPAPAEVLALDVDVLIPGPARVEGRGVESLWRGKLDITGDAADPRLSGKLTLMRGTLAFGSRSFTLSEGEITFDGGPTIDPRIKMVATQTEADFTASITLSGRAAQPDLSVSSVPAAPQDEVFARLLFGRSITNISPLEALELANSIAALSGSGSAGGVLSNLRDRFGLDVLAVDVGENGQVGVKAGTYISRNVYFELRQGGDSAGAKGRLEIQIDENISVETEVGADSSSSVGARYKIDY